MLTDMLDLYGGDRLAGTRIITLLDGPREEEIGYQRWLDRGPQLREIQQGALAGLLPQSDPANDVIWVILRFGGGKIPQYLAQIGYTQIGSIRYTDTDLLLFARPGAQIGSPVQMDPRYSEATGNSDGWRYANKNVAVRAAGAIWEMVLTGDRSVSTYRFTTQSGGLVVGRIDAQVPAGSLAVTMSCVSANGDVLRSSRATSQKKSADWQSISVAGLCPERTATVEVRFQHRGEGNVILRNAQLEFNPNQN
jgi:hypothetical protein